MLPAIHLNILQSHPFPAEGSSCGVGIGGSLPMAATQAGLHRPRLLLLYVLKQTHGRMLHYRIHGIKNQQATI